MGAGAPRGKRKTVRVFAAGNPHWYTVQCHVMVMAGDDPLDAASWQTPQRCRTIEGGVLCPDGITLDMTCFTVGQVPTWSGPSG